MEPVGSGHDGGLVNGFTHAMRGGGYLILVAVDFLPAMALGNRKQNHIIFSLIVLHQHVLLRDPGSRYFVKYQESSDLHYTVYLRCIVDKVKVAARLSKRRPCNVDAHS